MTAARNRGQTAAVVDPIFALPRLASLYDEFDGDRSDLDLYESIVLALGATSVLDIGCGTGSLATRLAALGIEVVGIDPAEASLAVARSKPFADRVRWVEASATALPDVTADVVTMTGNVAQVFVDDTEWRGVLAEAARVLATGGRFVFETRIPEARGWAAWTPERTADRRDVPGEGVVETWTELTDVSLPLVSFRTTYRFPRDGAVLRSDSTLRFRADDEIRADLADVGLRVVEVHDAPDRPGLEWVFEVAHA